MISEIGSLRNIVQANSNCKSVIVYWINISLPKVKTVPKHNAEAPSLQRGEERFKEEGETAKKDREEGEKQGKTGI